MRREQIKQCLEGRATAIHGFVAEYRRRLLPGVLAAYGVVPTSIGDAALDDDPRVVEAAETTARIFDRALALLGTAPAGPGFYPWLRGVAISVLIERVPGVLSPASSAAQAPPAAGTAIVPIDDSVEPSRLAAAVFTLPPRQRLLLWLLARERLNLSDAALHLGAAGYQVRGELHEALQAIRKHVGRETTRTVAGGAPMGDLLTAIYGHVDGGARATLEQVLVKDPASQRLYEALGAERLTLTNAFTDHGVGTTDVLRHLRRWHRFGRRGIRPWFWVGIELVLATTIALFLLLNEAHVPEPVVIVEREVGSAVLNPDATGPHADDRQKLFANALEAARDDDETNGGERSARFALHADDVVETESNASIRLLVSGNNPVEIGPSTRFRFGRPTREYNVRFALEPSARPTHERPDVNQMGGPGIGWCNFTGLDRPFAIDTASATITGEKAEFLVHHVPVTDATGDTTTIFADGDTLTLRLRVVCFAGEIDLSARIVDTASSATDDLLFAGNDGTDERDEPTLTLVAGQGALVWLDGAGELQHAPLPEFRVLGFPYGEGPLAVSLDYVVRYYRGTGDRFKVRYHWLELTRFPFSLDAAPPIVLDFLALVREQAGELERPIDETEQLENSLKASLERLVVVRAEHLHQATGLRGDLAALAELAAELEAQRQQLAEVRDRIATFRSNEPGQTRYDPFGVARFALEARWLAMSAKKEEQRSLRTERNALAAWLEPQLPRLESAQATLRSREAELAGLDSELDALDGFLAASADILERLADAENDLAIRQRALEIAQGEAERAGTVVDAATEEADAAHAALDAAVNRAREIETAFQALELARRNLDQAAAELQARGITVDAARHRVNATTDDLSQPDLPTEERERLQAELQVAQEQLAEAEQRFIEQEMLVAERGRNQAAATAAYEALDPDGAPDIDDARERVRAADAALADAERRSDLALDSITSMRRLVRQNERTVEDLEDTLAEREEKLTERGELADHVTDATLAVETARGTLEEFEARVDPTRDRLTELDGLLAEREGLAEQLAAITGRMDQIDLHDRRIRALQNRSRDLASDITRLGEATSDEERARIEYELCLANYRRGDIDARITRQRLGLLLLSSARERYVAETLTPRRNHLHERAAEALLAIAHDYEGLSLDSADHLRVLRLALARDLEYTSRAGLTEDESRAKGVFAAYRKATLDLFKARELEGPALAVTVHDLRSPPREGYEPIRLAPADD